MFSTQQTRIVLRRKGDWQFWQYPPYPPLLLRRKGIPYAKTANRSFYYYLFLYSITYKREFRRKAFANRMPIVPKPYKQSLINMKPKYNNKKVVIDGITFDSKKEASRWQQLRLAEAEGAISDLQRQVVYEIAPAVHLDGRKRPARKYVADFVYRRPEGDSVAVVVEDVKGMKLPEYRLKRHLMKAIHGIEVVEV